LRVAKAARSPAASGVASTAQEPRSRLRLDPLEPSAATDAASAAASAASAAAQAASAAAEAQARMQVLETELARVRNDGKVAQEGLLQMRARLEAAQAQRSSNALSYVLAVVVALLLLLIVVVLARRRSTEPEARWWAGSERPATRTEPLSKGASRAGAALDES